MIFLITYLLTHFDSNQFQEQWVTDESDNEEIDSDYADEQAIIYNSKSIDLRLAEAQKENELI